MKSLPPLAVITKDLEVDFKISLKNLIEERRLLRLKDKLLQIYLLDKDLESLQKYNISLKDINLEDIYITNEYLLYSPIIDRIITKKNDKFLKLRSYFIYLSYLYNIDFISIYQNNPDLFYELMSYLDIYPDIKNNFFSLLKDGDAPFFNSYINEIDDDNNLSVMIHSRLKLVKKLNEMSSR